MRRTIAFLLPALITVALQVVVSTYAPAQSSPVDMLVRIPPTQIIDSTLFSPDGKAIATVRYEGNVYEGGKPCTLQLWAVPKGTLLWTARKPMSRLFAFSPDSTLLVGIAQDGTVVFWDT